MSGSPPAREPLALLLVRSGVYAITAWLLLRTMLTTPGLVAVVLAVGIGVYAADRVAASALRLAACLAVALVTGLAGAWIGAGMLAWVGPGGVTATTVLYASDALYFGSLVLLAVFSLRLLSGRMRVFSAVEAGLVVAAVALTFTAHRNQRIHRPRFLADWALSRGYDPQLILQGLGLCAVVLAVLALLRTSRVSKIALSLAAVAALAATAYRWTRQRPLEPQLDTNGLNLTSQEQTRHPKGGQGAPVGGDGSGDTGRRAEQRGDRTAQSDGAAGPEAAEPPKGPKATESPKGPEAVEPPKGTETVGQPKGPDAVAQPEGPKAVAPSKGSKTPGQPKGSDAVAQPMGPKAVAPSKGSATVGPPTGSEAAGPPTGPETAGQPKGRGAAGQPSRPDPSRNPDETDDAGRSSGPSPPVGVMILRDEYQPESGFFYLRELVVSRLEGFELVRDPARDRDVIADFPAVGPQTVVREVTEAGARRDVPTSVFLMADHPEPVALTAAVRLEAVRNPDPRRFVAAYGVVSSVVTVAPARWVGRRSIPASWTPEERAAYTRYPDDPRYAELAQRLVAALPARLRTDPFAQALVVKRYLEERGFYTRSERYRDTSDPVAAFLFGSMRGYCVHFSAAAVYLFRSLGIAARVAKGYAVSAERRGGGSAVVIPASAAHAWPELHLVGLGWVTLDVHPERSDERPPPDVDPDLERALGERARGDPSGGRAPDPEAPARIARPLHLARWLGWLLAALLLMGYAVKVWRRLAVRFGSGPRTRIRVFAAVLDRLSEIAVTRRHGETRERFARRLATQCPSLRPLTDLHLADAMGARQTASLDRVRVLAIQALRELDRSTPAYKRWLGHLNPVGWAFTR